MSGRLSTLFGRVVEAAQQEWAQELLSVEVRGVLVALGDSEYFSEGAEAVFRDLARRRLVPPATLRAEREAEEAVEAAAAHLQASGLDADRSDFDVAHGKLVEARSKVSREASSMRSSSVFLKRGRPLIMAMVERLRWLLDGERIPDSARANATEFLHFLAGSGDEEAGEEGEEGEGEEGEGEGEESGEGEQRREGEMERDVEMERDAEEAALDVNEYLALSRQALAGVRLTRSDAACDHSPCCIARCRRV